MPTISMFYGIIISLYFYGINSLTSTQNTKGRMLPFPFSTERY